MMLPDVFTIDQIWIRYFETKNKTKPNQTKNKTKKQKQKQKQKQKKNRLVELAYSQVRSVTYILTLRFHKLYRRLNAIRS